jgi:hypothetical protein
MQSNCIAAIWRNDFGLELRVLHGDQTPLLLIAGEVKADLIAQG